MLDIYEKDYVKDVKKKVNEAEVNKPAEPVKPDNTNQIENLQRKLEGLMKRKETIEDAVQKAKIDKQIADIHLQMANLKK